jgi:hypothetical protein
VGPLVSERKTKEKERSGAGWRGEKADGPLGQKGREVSFFSFSFSNSFQIKLFPFKFKPKSFKPFYKIS